MKIKVENNVQNKVKDRAQTDCTESLYCSRFYIDKGLCNTTADER